MLAEAFDAILDQITRKDPRYHRDGYHFVREGLEHTQKTIVAAEGSKLRHVTGQELLEGIRQYALDQFGPMTLTVLEAWGIRCGADFGEMVFNMIDAGILAKTERDTREDFMGGYDFSEAFEQPFLPKNISSLRPPPEAPVT